MTCVCLPLVNILYKHVHVLVHLKFFALSELANSGVVFIVPFPWKTVKVWHSYPLIGFKLRLDEGRCIKCLVCDN